MALKSYTMDMCNGPLFGKMLAFALPVMLMNILQLLFNAVDMIVVGRFSGSLALAAVGATGALINLIVTFFMGLSVGTSVIVAQDYGSGDLQAVNRSVHTSVAVSIIGGLLVMVIGLVFCRPMLVVMGTPADIIDQSTTYMRIFFVGMPASLIYNFGAAILRAVGDSRRPMYYLIFSGVINVILNLIFVVGLHMGVAGVAWATVIAQYVALVLIMACLMRSDEIVRFDPRQICLDRKKLIQLVRVGLPAGMQGFLFSVSNVLVQSAINSFGSTLVAASAAAGNIEGFIGTSMNAYYIAAISFTGQNMGGRKFGRIDSVARIVTVLVFSTWLVLGGLTILFGRPLLSLFTTDPAVVELGMVRITVMMAAYFTCGIMNVFPGLTRGMGYSILPMISTLIGACLLRIVWLGTFFAWYPTVLMLFLCYPITWSIAGLGQVGSFFYARRQIRKKFPEADDSSDVSCYV